MYAQVEKPKENKCKSIADTVSQSKSSGKLCFGFEDNRPEAVAQRKLQEEINNYSKIHNRESIPVNFLSSVVQGYFIADVNAFMRAQEKRKTKKGNSFLNESGEANITMSFKGKMRVSNECTMAIEEGGDKRQAKMFYALPKITKESNEILKNIGSPIRMASNSDITINVPKKNGGQNTLHLIYPIDIESKKIGDEVKIPQRCNEAAPYIAHTGDVYWLEPKYKDGNKQTVPKDKLGSSVDVRLAAMLPLLLKKKEFESGSIVKKFVVSFFPWWENFYPELQKLGKGAREYFGILEKSGDEKATINKFAKRYVDEFLKKHGSKDILLELGINEFIDPDVGDVLSIRSIGAERTEGSDWYVKDYGSGKELKNPFQYHFATVIAKSGTDYITMENYARQEEEGNKSHPIGPKDPRYYFQMYGSEEQSFHSEQKDEYANAMTLAFSPSRNQKNVELNIDSEPVKKRVNDYNKKLNLINSKR